MLINDFVPHLLWFIRVICIKFPNQDSLNAMLEKNKAFYFCCWKEVFLCFNKQAVIGNAEHNNHRQLKYMIIQLFFVIIC